MDQAEKALAEPFAFYTKKMWHRKVIIAAGPKALSTSN